MDDLIILDSKNLENVKQKADLETTISHFLKNFLSDNTRMAYTTDFYDFAAFLNLQGIRLKGPHEINMGHIIDYRDSLDGVYAPNTIHRKLSSLSSLFNKLVNAKLMSENPVLGVDRPKAIAIRDKTGLSDAEIDQICEFYDGKTIQSLNNKAILTFLSYTGCRISEAINVRVSDIREKNDVRVVLIHGKGSKIRKIPIHPKLWSVLKELMRRREKIEDDYIFTAVQKNIASPIRRHSVHAMLKKTLMSLGMDIDKTLHSFRRGVISNLLENGHRIESVAEVSGHSNINTTKGYLVREEKIEDNPLLSLNFKKS
ncbi:MAG: tyrosine-type recombinase/integrase [Halobacteriovoraceae bacterium]|nr:tyrosine-type recombinase/integrase [Halobacteriovoraceae bacterium]